MLIELSPFLPCTGPALFKWSTDRPLLENGPFEFRLQTVVHPHMDDLLEVNWDDRWRAKIPRYDHFYSLATASEGAPAASPTPTTKAPSSLSVPRAGIHVASFALALTAIATVQSSPLVAKLAALSALGSLSIALYYTAQSGKAVPRSIDQRPHLMFFYGTLKRNFHWNKKFLGQVSILVYHLCT